MRDFESTSPVSADVNAIGLIISIKPDGEVEIVCAVFMMKTIQKSKLRRIVVVDVLEQRVCFRHIVCPKRECLAYPVIIVGREEVVNEGRPAWVNGLGASAKGREHLCRRIHLGRRGEGLVVNITHIVARVGDGRRTGSQFYWRRGCYGFFIITTISGLIYPIASGSSFDPSSLPKRNPLLGLRRKRTSQLGFW